MAKYRKKQELVDVQVFKPGMEDGIRKYNEFIPKNGDTYPERARSKKHKGYHCSYDSVLDSAKEDGWVTYIEIANEMHTVLEGDYIVTEADGSRQVWQPVAFKGNFERVSETEVDNERNHKNNFQPYLGVKILKHAEPMTKELYESNKANSPNMDGSQVTEGYLVIYQDGYESWSPKDVFEKAYMKIGPNNSIEEHNIDDFIKSYDVSQWGDKTTVVHATLANGFIITESSSCVDAKNFNMDIGVNICKEKIQNRVWEMLGFMLQTGMNGLK